MVEQTLAEKLERDVRGIIRAAILHESDEVELHVKYLPVIAEALAAFRPRRACPDCGGQGIDTSCAGPTVECVACEGRGTLSQPSPDVEELVGRLRAAAMHCGALSDVNHLFDEAANALTALSPGWRPMDSVPKELDKATGCWWIKKCLIRVPTKWGGTTYVAQMDADQWLIEYGEPGVYSELIGKPIAWMPLPPAPASEPHSHSTSHKGD